MQGILADVNLAGQFRSLLFILESEEWREIWTSLKLTVQSFPSLGLSWGASDHEIWFACQQNQLVLITANRNHDGPESLEAVIRSSNSKESLPVLTVADPDRLRTDRDYAELVAEKLLDYLLHVDDYRGTGRLYIP